MMFDFIHDHKGSISIFVLFVMLPVMIVELVLIDFARIMAVRGQAAAAAETYANSYLSIYDEVLNDVYGLFAVSQSKEGLEALDALREYIKSAYDPSARSASGTVGSTELLDRIQDLLGSDYSGALSLTGGALQDLNAAVGTGSIQNRHLGKSTDGDYDELMMQICEYVKFIGPTEVAISALSKLLSSGGGTEDLDAAADTKDKYEMIEEKKRIDEQLRELNKDVENLYESMIKYEMGLGNLRDKAVDIAGYSVSRYGGAMENLINSGYGMINVIKDAQEAAKEAKKTKEREKQQSSGDNNDSDSSDSSDSNTSNSSDSEEEEEEEEGLSSFELGQLSNYYDSVLDIMPFYISSGSGNTYFDKNDPVKGWDIMNYNDYLQYYVRDYVVDCGWNDGPPHDVLTCNGNADYTNICVSHSREYRDDVAAKARLVEQHKHVAVEKIEQLIQQARGKGEEDFAAGLEKEYDAILNDNTNQMYYIMNYDYNQFADTFQNDGVNCENLIRDDMWRVYTALHDYDDAIANACDKISELYTDATSPNCTLSELSTDELRQAIRDLDDLYDKGYRFQNRDEFKFRNSTLMDYYTYFEDNTSPRYTYENISIKKVYEVLQRWNTAPNEEKKKEKEDLENLADSLADLAQSLTFDNIKVRCQRETPEGYGAGGGEEEKKNLSNLFKSNSNASSDSSSLIPKLEATGFSNKLMLMMYSYGMMTCHTSDMVEKKDANGTPKIERKQPVSYQGINLAANNKKDNDDKDGYESSETNFLLYGEMEYIFGGMRSSQANFSKVRNSLAIIRFVPNYISTYSITEINNIINAVNSALSWCPLVAIVVTQLLRIAIAAMETWCDLDQLYGGYSVMFYKQSMGDMSFVGKIRNTPFFSKLNNLCGGGLNNTNKKSGGKAEIAVNYQAYLIILQFLFVSTDDMITRLCDIITVNMNYITNPSCASAGDDGVTKMTLGDDAWKPEKAYTAVEVTCETSSKFVFIGGVVNLNGSEYQNVSDAAREFEDSNSNYKTAAVVKSY